VSVEAISWALNMAPVPADRGRAAVQRIKLVLVGLANRAGPDGTGAFPSVAMLVRYTGLSERTVRTCLHRLETAGITVRSRRRCGPAQARRPRLSQRNPDCPNLFR
jgi:DNA-binding transcriptional regulator PaaX